MPYQWIGEIEVQRDKAALLKPANVNHVTVGGALEVLIGNGGDIMPCPAKTVSTTIAEVLIEL